jgi:hypothetical protein
LKEYADDNSRDAQDSTAHADISRAYAASTCSSPTNGDSFSSSNGEAGG